jgi:hypothetical protein
VVAITATTPNMQPISEIVIMIMMVMVMVMVMVM